MDEVLHLSTLYIHPIKSGRGLSPSAINVAPRGPVGDRRWMVVDLHGQFLTGRQHPKLTQLTVEPVAIVEPGIVVAALDINSLRVLNPAELQEADLIVWRVQAPGRAPLLLAPPSADAARLEVTIWRRPVVAPLADAASAEWISEFLGVPAQLVYMDPAAVLPVSAEYGQPGDEVSFADGFPLLLISEGSLAGLNARLQERQLGPMSMRRFRPNLVVSAKQPHAEDQWRRIRIGSLEFDVVKPCSRCVFTTIDPETAIANADYEPIRTLSSYRRTAGGVMFGQNVIARGVGRIQVGDRVEVLG